MGLDMMLYGDKSIYVKDTPAKVDGFPVEVDGFPVESIVLDMGYWRKHANLHGFIVDCFADGNDDCQRINLDVDDLNHLIKTLEDDKMYEETTTGFFFGRSYHPGEKDEYGSYEEQKARDIDLFTKARNWLMSNYSKKDEYRSVYYQASW